MSKVNKIGFGIMLGSLFTMLPLTIFFGNDKEVLCALPALILGYYLYELNQNKDEKENRNTIKRVCINQD